MGLLPQPIEENHLKLPLDPQEVLGPGRVIITGLDLACPHCQTIWEPTDKAREMLYRRLMHRLGDVVVKCSDCEKEAVLKVEGRGYSIYKKA